MVVGKNIDYTHYDIVINMLFCRQLGEQGWDYPLGREGRTCEPLWFISVHTCWMLKVYRTLPLAPAMVYMFVSPQNHMSLAPRLMIFRSRTFKSWSFCQGGALINGIRFLVKEAPEIFSPLPLREDAVKKCHGWTRKWILIRYRICWGLDLGLLSLQNCEK